MKDGDDEHCKKGREGGREGREKPTAFVVYSTLIDVEYLTAPKFMKL